MADIRIDLGDEINGDDMERLRQRLIMLTPNDQLTIGMQAADAHQADRIIAELERQGFDYQPRGGDGKDYFVVVRKRLH